MKQRVKRLRPSDRLLNAAVKHGVCECGRRGMLVDGFCAPPRDVKCQQRRTNAALRAAPRID